MSARAKPRRSSLETLSSHERVDLVDDERGNGNGVIVTLKKGWSFEPGMDNRVSGEDSPTAMLAAVRGAHAFAGPYTD